MASLKDLKACPCCNSPNIGYGIQVVRTDKTLRQAMYEIRCRCGIKVQVKISDKWPSKELPHGGRPVDAYRIVQRKARERAIAIWNKRPAQKCCADTCRNCCPDEHL